MFTQLPIVIACSRCAPCLFWRLSYDRLRSDPSFSVLRIRVGRMVKVKGPLVSLVDSLLSKKRHRILRTTYTHLEIQSTSSTVQYHAWRILIQHTQHSLIATYTPAPLGPPFIAPTSHEVDKCPFPAACSPTNGIRTARLR
jgi:hypothetical protein